MSSPRREDSPAPQRASAAAPLHTTQQTPVVTHSPESVSSSISRPCTASVAATEGEGFHLTSLSDITHLRATSASCVADTLIIHTHRHTDAQPADCHPPCCYGYCSKHVRTWSRTPEVSWTVTRPACGLSGPHQMWSEPKA